MLEGLIAGLAQASGKIEDLEGVMKKITFGISEVERFCHFARARYTRNLIARDHNFELLLLCWEPGQITPIHDHGGSDGWVFGVQGTFEEVQYHPEGEIVDGAEMRVGSIAKVEAGALSHIDDGIAWHTVANIGDGRAVSLHLYSPPIESCRTYRPDTKKFEVRRLAYHSVNGIIDDP